MACANQSPKQHCCNVLPRLANLQYVVFSPLSVVSYILFNSLEFSTKHGKDYLQVSK